MLGCKSSEDDKHQTPKKQPHLIAIADVKCGPALVHAEYLGQLREGQENTPAKREHGVHRSGGAAVRRSRHRQALRGLMSGLPVFLVSLAIRYR